MERDAVLDAPVAPAATEGTPWLARAQCTISRALGLILLLAVAVNFANVVARYVFDHAFLGAEEVQVFLMVWIAFIGAAVVASRHEHLRMDLIALRLPAAWRETLARLEALLAAALALFMLWQSASFTWQMIELGRTSDALGVPMAIPHSGMVLGFALLSLVALLRLIGARMDGAHKPEGMS